MQRGGPRRQSAAARELVRDRGEAGFTLAELLVVVVILGVVAAVIAMAVVVSGKSATQTSQRVKESHDAQIASAYLATDVQSSQLLTTATCAPSTPLTGQVTLVNFSYDGASSIASYLYGTSGGETQVVRTFCTSGGGLLSAAPIVHYAGPRPTVTCPTTNCYPGGDATQTPSNPKPTTVKMAFTDHNPSSGTDDYTFAVSGTRRQYAGAGNPPQPGNLPRLLALASPSGCGGVALTVTGNGTVTVNGGDVIVNSTCQPAAAQGGNGNLSITSGVLQIVSPGTCSGCTTTPTTRLSPVPDPFLGLSIPDDSAAGLSVFTDGNPAHGPGVYRSTPLTFPNGTTVLAPGVYVVEAGFSFAGQAIVDGTSGVLLFNGCGLNAPPSCTNTGQFSVTGQNELVLNPISTGPYAGTNLTIWQPVANTSPITIAGNGVTNSINGVIYAPGASSVTLSAGNGNLSIGYVIAPNITITGSPTGNVTIG